MRWLKETVNPTLLLSEATLLHISLLPVNK